MPRLSAVVGVVTLLLWLSYLPVTRRYLRESGSIMFPTVFQYNFLPLFVGIGLTWTGTWWWLLAGLVGWLAAPSFLGRSSVFVLPLVFGAILGVQIAADISGNWPWLVGGGVIGVICSLVIRSIVFAAVGLYSE